MSLRNLIAPALLLLMVGFAVLILYRFPEHGGVAVDRTYTLAMIFLGGGAVKTGVGEFRKNGSS